MCIGETTVPFWVYLIQETSGLGALVLLNFLLWRKTLWYKKYMWTIIALSLIVALFWTGISFADLFNKTECV